jgi:putative transposase
VKKSRFRDSQILATLTKGGSGIPVAEVCRKHGISSPSFYHWKSKYAGMSLPELKRVKELEAENAKLMHIYAELALENTAIKDVLSRKL